MGALTALLLAEGCSGVGDEETGLRALNLLAQVSISYFQAAIHFHPLNILKFHFLCEALGQTT